MKERKDLKANSRTEEEKKKVRKVFLKRDTYMKREKVERRQGKFKTRRKRKESENCSKSVIYMKIEREKRSQRKFKARRKEKESE